MRNRKIFAMFLVALMVFIATTASVFAATLTGTQLTVHSFSSEQPTGGGVTTSGLAALAVDGNTNTCWNDQYSPEESAPPNWIVFDMGAVHTVTGFAELPRQDGWSGLANGNIKNYTLSYSTNGTDFTTIKSGTFDDASSDWQSTTFTGVSARYIKIEQPDNPDDNYVAIAEVRIVTTDSNPQTGDSGMTYVLVALALAALATVIALGKKVIRN